MIQQFSEIAELFIGFDAYPKSKIVDYLVSTSNQTKTQWNNKSDAIFNSYHRAVTEYNYPIWNITGTSDNDKIINYITAETGLPRNDVSLYLITLYTMAKQGKIETQYWNPKAVGALEQYGINKVTEQIKNVIAPVTQTAGTPAKKLLITLLIAGGLTTIGIIATKTAIKEKAKKYI